MAVESEDGVQRTRTHEPGQQRDQAYQPKPTRIAVDEEHAEQQQSDNDTHCTISGTYILWHGISPSD
jgi:hypothetical protein